MPVVRVHKTKNYTVMSNYHLREKTMTLKTKGLLSLMLSLPEDWDYSIAGLTTLSADSRDMVNKSLLELEQFGYLYRDRDFVKGRFAGYVYNIYEEPLPPERRKPTVEAEKAKKKSESPKTQTPTVSGNTVYGQTVNDSTVNGQGSNGTIYNINNNINNKYNKQILNKQITIDTGNADTEDESNKTNYAPNGKPLDDEYLPTSNYSESDESQCAANANAEDAPKTRRKKKPTLELTEEEKNKFQTMVSFYPNQTHDLYKISNRQRKAILDTVSVDEMKRAIQRYVDSKEDWRYYKDISTWFLGAYIGYTDAEWNKSHPQDTLEKTSPDSDYDENGVRIRSR
jgi:hypothetical protein